MSDVPAYIGIGIICTVFYMVMGIGVARTQKHFRLFLVFFWPIALGVIAYCGEVADE